MANLKVIAIRDIKNETYGIPFYAKTFGGAIRSLQMELEQNPKSAMAQFPEDYELWSIGTYDEEAGQLGGTNDPKMILKINEIAIKKEEVQK